MNALCLIKEKSYLSSIVKYIKNQHKINEKEAQLISLLNKALCSDDNDLIADYYIICLLTINKQAMTSIQNN